MDCHEVLHQGMCPRSNAYVVPEGDSSEHSSSHDRFHQLLPAVIPHSMKSAVVTPLLKKPSLNINILKNYRLVSSLPFVLERVVALLEVQNDILQTVDHGGVAVLVLLGLSAVFDTIDHSILLDRIQHQLGINGVAHAWFESYLTGCTQRFQIDDVWSLAKFLLYCVPQGSLLGPLLFLIYILPLHHLILSHGLQVQP